MRSAIVDCMISCDVGAMRALWPRLFPHIPAPTCDYDALCTLHHARTQSPDIALAMRQYSHAWLRERGLPSGLPDDMWPAAERIHPRVAEAVGIACAATSDLVRPITGLLRKAMEVEVFDTYAGTKKPDPAKLKARMLEAKRNEMRRLIGKIGA